MKWCVVPVCALTFIALGTTVAHAATGSLTQKAGTAGCISIDGTGGQCVVGKGLNGADWVAVSPDGKNAYVASEPGSVAVFDRDPGTGALTQKAGTAGCFEDTRNGGVDCAGGRVLRGAHAVTVSPDGISVYVAALSNDSNAVAVFARDPATGALSQDPGVAGCVSEAGAGGCGVGKALANARSVTVSPDGKNAYVASQGSGAVAIFDRDPGTGALTQKAGTAGCVSDSGTGGDCVDGKALINAWSVTVSPDGKSAYVVGPQSGGGADVGAVAVFDRDTGTGALTQKAGTAGCVSDSGTGGDCADGKALAAPVSVTVSPDDANVYAASNSSSAVAVFDRDPGTGALTQKAGTAGCVSETGTGGECADGKALGGSSGGTQSVTVSPDGSNAYVASDGSTVAIFDRDPASGALSQQAGTAGCIAQGGSFGACATGKALSGVSYVTVSPDGNNAYAAASSDDAVAIFDRESQSADLSITKTDLADPVTAGTNVTYNLAVKNDGPASATGVMATDVLPSGTTFVSADAGCVHAAGVVTCTAGALASGAGKSFDVVVQTTLPDTLSNTATVDGDQPDPVASNDSDTETTTATAGTTRTLTVTLSGAGSGTVTGTGINCGGGSADCSETVAHGAQITLRATPTGGSSFGGFTGGGCEGANPCTLTMDAAKAVDAQFTAPPPTTSGAPKITKMTTAEELVAGRPGVLNAEATGGVQRLDWDLNSDGKTDVTCPGDQTTLRFRPPATATGRARAAAFGDQVTVRAIGQSGVDAVFTQVFTVAPSPVAAKLSAPLKRVADFAQTKPPVYACGLAADVEAAKNELTGNFALPNRPGLLAQILESQCQTRTLSAQSAGSLRVTGCFTAIRSAKQIPEAELGSLKPVLDVARLPKSFQIGPDPESSTDTTFGTLTDTRTREGKFVEKALDFQNAYISDGSPVLVNGVKIEPQGKGRIVVFPQVRRIFSADAAMSVGGIKLEHPSAFSWNTSANSVGRIPLGDFPRRSGGVANLAGFALTGDVGVTLTPGTAANPGGAELHVELKLPRFLDLLPGVPALDDLKVVVTQDGGLVLDNIVIGPIDASIGPVGVSDFKITYIGAAGEWHGGADLCAEGFACLSARESPESPAGGIVIRDGALKRLNVDLIFPDPGIALYPGVFLNRVGAGFGLDPTRLFGRAKVTAAQIFEIDGALVLAFPSTAAPFRLTHEEAGDAFPAEFYTRPYTRATLALGADAYLRIPIIDARLRLGGAYLLFNAPAYVAFGGGIDYDFGVVSVEGTTEGEFNFANGRFNLGGRVELCVVDIFCRGSVAYVSSVGAGGCVEIDAFIGSINIGGGLRYPDDVLLWPFDGCKWSRFHDPNVFQPKVQAAQAGVPIKAHIKAGDPGTAVRLDGVDGAPRVRVTGPGGLVLESPQGPGYEVTKEIRILRSEELKATVVGLQDPAPGTYTIKPLPDSAVVKKITEAEDPPDAKIDASVATPGGAAAAAAAAGGGRRTLKYNIRKRPGQRVTFVETGPDGNRPLGSVAGGRGKLTFTPAPGRGPRKIEAQFELAGLRAETRTVASFMPPSQRLGRPTRLRVRRHGTSLRVSWKRVAGATRYNVVTTLASGGQRKTRTRGNKITIARVTKRSGGRVAVRATASLREGAARSAHFRATGRRAPTRLGRLPRFGRKG